MFDPLSPARAYGAPLGSGRLRAAPEDFEVREWLGFEADNTGDHLLLTVRKRGANTLWVARSLARQAGVHPREIGFAGLKDRDAVTEQAFTVPAMKSTPESWTGFAGEGFKVLSAARQRRKLRRGAHKGNDFRIVVREFQADPNQLQTRLEAIGSLGVPNYFGAQRFGRRGNNLRVAEEWFRDGRPPRDRSQRGFALSAARSVVFNAVLSQRVTESTWNRLQAGDVANLDGSGSVFAVSEPDAALLQRCEELDIHPTGPMWGEGDLMSGAQVAELEHRCAGEFPGLRQGMENAGLRQERRALRVRVQCLAWTLDDAKLTLQFRLARGAFATAVMAEIVAGISSADIEEGDDA